MDTYHITFKDNEWKFTKSGNSRASRTADTKDKIINKMQDYMSDHVGSVKIHKKNGRFQEERTYPRSSDPSSSPG